MRAVDCLTIYHFLKVNKSRKKDNISIPDGLLRFLFTVATSLLVTCDIVLNALNELLAG